jgi:hypothetical protein
MNIKVVTSIVAIALFSAANQMSNGADITATGSGNWSSTVPDAPWPGGIVPGTNDDVDVETPNAITVDSNAVIQYIYGSGTITMAANSTLVILGDPAGSQATYQLSILDTSAPSNTVVYTGNPFWAKHQDYYNLMFSNTVTTTLDDFYNGFVNSQDPAANMTIAGDMTIVGKIKVQQGADFAILGNLNMGANSQWDCSSFKLTVGGNTTIGGLMLDLNGALGTNYFGGNLTVTPSGAWNVSDVVHWGVGGSLTNNGLMVGKGYGSISFDGTGSIAGSSSLTIPTITVNGTYTMGTTITLLTNTPTLNGTLIFDLANTNQLVLESYPTNQMVLYYSGNLVVTNTGPTPSSGSTYHLFNAIGYNGAFGTETLPPLPAGLNWDDNLLLDGSISVSGSVIGGGSPVLTYSRSGNTLQLSWDSLTFPGYSVVARTNSLGSTWYQTGSGTTSPFTVNIDQANASVFFRLSHP